MYRSKRGCRGWKRERDREKVTDRQRGDMTWQDDEVTVQIRLDASFYASERSIVIARSTA